MFYFSDIDRDGMVDMLFLTDSNRLKLVVNYNNLQP